MRYDRDELLARTDLAALADELLGYHVGNGRNARWPSPVPNHPQTGRTPPMSIFVDHRGIQRWTCFATGANGTAIDLVTTATGRSIGDTMTLVSLTLTIDGTESVAGLVAKAHELFPRLYREPEIRRSSLAASGTGTSGFDRSDVAGTVRRYLEMRLGDDPDAKAVVPLADELLASEELATLVHHDADITEGTAP